MTETFDPAKHLTIFHDAINALDYQTIERYFADDAIYVSGGVGGRIDGRDAIMIAFRKYFDAYPDQVAEDTLVENVGPLAARSVWKLNAIDSRTGQPMVRTGEETLTFNAEGKIIRIDVTDY
ncbi:nuclear transport factor 2 family protein [Rhizobium sp. KVB221]|uniref:Nuclear transport factor 2 family protein n=1 Tax=Rhizobium setariae TaxID=2801340 RepID=A0A936YR86_9HYPH|nr:nuclear transport factor 2 family protein [Rhizobium setariae]MBL0370875.1 nuclear transport factor 2 family protein [Rhizobium setariae]